MTEKEGQIQLHTERWTDREEEMERERVCVCESEKEMEREIEGERDTDRQAERNSGRLNYTQRERGTYIVSKRETKREKGGRGGRKKESR